MVNHIIDLGAENFIPRLAGIADPGSNSATEENNKKTGCFKDDPSVRVTWPRYGSTYCIQWDIRDRISTAINPPG